MIIKYCKKCPGQPYTIDLNVDSCPRCGSELGLVSIDESELSGRPQLSVAPTPAPNYRDPYSHDDSYGSSNGSGTDLDHRRPGGRNLVSRTTAGKGAETSASLKSVTGSVISGKLTRYSVTDSEKGYKRLFVIKLFDALVYHQRMDDILHRFTVRVDQGKDSFGYSNFKDVPVNVHGVISGGAQLDENADVEVTGKYKNNILMAQSINIVNSGYRSRVNFQRSRQGILYGILAAVAIIFLIYVGVSSKGGFFENIGSFFVAWLISAVIVTVLYFVLFMSRFGWLMAARNKGFPFAGILLVSFIMALLYMNMFGLGTSVGGALSGALSSILPSIIVIVAIVFLIRLIFKG